jgi:hypothetical protein
MQQRIAHARTHVLLAVMRLRLLATTAGIAFDRVPPAQIQCTALGISAKVV